MRTLRKKRLPQEEDPPRILVNKTSTLTLVEEPVDINANLLSPTIQSTNNRVQLAIKPNGFNKKKAWYKSHKNFLTKCVEENIIPKGLILELKQRIKIITRNSLITDVGN